MMENAKKDDTLTGNPPPAWAPWAYPGTDETAERFFPLLSKNSLPAMLVWLTMTTGRDLQNSLDEQKLADAIGLTQPCVHYIRALMEKEPAFEKVADLFVTIQSRTAAGNYPPAVCPTLTDITDNFAPIALNKEPTQASKEATAKG
jgi:hypothetical protein